MSRIIKKNNNILVGGRNSGMGPDAGFGTEANRILNTSMDGPLKEGLKHAVDASTTLGSLFSKIAEVLVAWSPLVEPPIFLITGGPCLISLLFSKVLCAPLWLAQAGVRGLKNMLIGGSNYSNSTIDKNDSNSSLHQPESDFTRIFDPISNQWYHIDSTRGQATLMGMVGQVHLDVVTSHLSSVGLGISER